MRLRARYLHHLEVLTDNVVGLIINYWMTYWIMNWLLGEPYTHTVNLIFTAIMFGISYGRKYFFRRSFSNWIKKEYEKQTGED